MFNRICKINTELKFKLAEIVELCVCVDVVFSSAYYMTPKCRDLHYRRCCFYSQTRICSCFDMNIA